MTTRRSIRCSSALASFAAVAALGGCSHTIPKYVAPAAGERAQLVTRGDVQPGEAYGVYLFHDPRQCAGLREVGMGGAGRDPETGTIATGLQTAEVFLVKTNRSICRVRWSFEPVGGHKYVVAAASTPGGCRAQILDATDPHNIVLEPSARRRDVGGRLCVPLAQTTRLGDAGSRIATVSESDLPIEPAPPRAANASVPAVSDDDLRQLQRK